MSSISASFNGIGSEVEADYLAEQIRRYMIQNYGLSAYKEGYKVFSTLNSSNQAAAVISLGVLSHMNSDMGLGNLIILRNLFQKSFQRTDLYYKLLMIQIILRTNLESKKI